MRVEEYVGSTIRARREELGMSQAEFGRKVGELLGRPWPRQAVSAAELGKRSLGVTEMVAIAHVLQTRPARLMAPPVGVSEVELGGITLSARALAHPDIGVADAYLSSMWDDYAHALSSTEQAHKALKVMGGKLTTAIAARETETMDPGRAEGEQ